MGRREGKEGKGGVGGVQLLAAKQWTLVGWQRGEGNTRRGRKGEGERVGGREGKEGPRENGVWGGRGNREKEHACRRASMAEVGKVRREEETK